MTSGALVLQVSGKWCWAGRRAPWISETDITLDLWKWNDYQGLKVKCSCEIAVPIPLEQAERNRLANLTTASKSTYRITKAAQVVTEPFQLFQELDCNRASRRKVTGVSRVFKGT